MRLRKFVKTTQRVKEADAQSSCRNQGRCRRPHQRPAETLARESALGMHAELWSVVYPPDSTSPSLSKTGSPHRPLSFKSHHREGVVGDYSLFEQTLALCQLLSLVYPSFCWLMHKNLQILLFCCWTLMAWCCKLQPKKNHYLPKCIWQVCKQLCLLNMQDGETNF